MFTFGRDAGITPSKAMMDELLNSRPGNHERGLSSDDGPDRGINFAMFLTMMGERLFEFDSETELLEAFASFDEDDSGSVKADEIRKWLSESGDRMDQKEVCAYGTYGRDGLLRLVKIDRFLKGSFLDRSGNFNYKDWVKVLRVNEDEPDADQP